MKPHWSIKVGSYTYKTHISLHNAYKTAERLQDEVLGIQIVRHTSLKDASRMGETG